MLVRSFFLTTLDVYLLFTFSLSPMPCRKTLNVHSFQILSLFPMQIHHSIFPFHLFSRVTLRCIQYSSGSHKCLHKHHIFYSLRASRMLRAQSSLKTLTSPAAAASQTPAFNIFKGAADLFRANIMMQRIFSKKIYPGILLKIFFFRCKNLTRLDATNTNISTEVKILFKQKII